MWDFHSMVIISEYIKIPGYTWWVEMIIIINYNLIYVHSNICF